MPLTPFKLLESFGWEPKAAFNNLLNFLPCGLTFVNQYGEPTWANKTAKEMLGHTISGDVDAGVENWSTVFGCLDPETEEPIPQEELAGVKALKTGEAHRQKLILKVENRPGILVDLQCVPMKSPSGLTVGLFSAFWPLE